jgi:hypothetical protein
MNEPNEAQQRLERLLDRTLRELPLRQAPATLESRVLANCSGAPRCRGGGTASRTGRRPRALCSW